MSKLQKICTRLRKEDIDKIKQRADDQGIPWQTYLRVLVTRALKRKEIVV